MSTIIAAEFLARGVNSSRWDYEKANRLPDEEFMEFHRQVMETYRSNGYWSTQEVPCWECHNPIPGPGSLIKYFGGSYDPACFKQRWGAERESESARDRHFGAYLDRLVHLLVENGR